jgi:antitoxin ParD1/3/4
MSTRNVVVTKAQDALIEDLIAQGRYQNASEILRAGLRMLEERENDLAEVQSRLQISIAQWRRGETIDAETAINAAYDEAVRRIDEADRPNAAGATKPRRHHRKHL